VYVITYYSSDPAILWKRRHAEDKAWGAGDPEYRGTMMYTSGDAKRQPELWDLRLWVVRKKLRWLDPDSTELALKADPSREFPYADIDGYRRPFVFRNRKIVLR
jgi:hypothetical protein